jgi:hypothetical protein
MSFVYHISCGEMLREKSLLVYWAAQSHNVTVISVKMDGYLGAVAPSDPWVRKWLRALRTEHF